MTAATLGLEPTPISVRKCQVKIFAKLQAAIGVRQGQGALDVVAHCFAGGVGQVVQGQDNNMVADTYAAIFAAIAHKSLLHRITTSWF